MAHRPPQPPERRPFGWVVAAGASGILAIVILVLTMGDGTEEPPPTTNPPATTPPTAPATSTTTTTLPPTTTTIPTTTTTTTTVPTTTTEPDPLAALVLTPAGIGDVPLGAEAEAALADLGSVLGDPTDDTGWVDAFSGFGTCPGSEVRVVTWASLQVFLSDGPTEFAEAGRHFFSYSHSALGPEPVLGLATNQGVRVGDTVADLEAAYQGALDISTDEVFGPMWIVDPAGPPVIYGVLTGTEPDDSVSSIAGGFGCGE